MRNLLFAFFILTMAVNSIAQQPPNLPPLINVNGSGSVRVDADLATVRLGVQAQAKAAKDAQGQASATAQKILDAIVKLGIDRKDIQTTSLSLFPIFSEMRPGQTTSPTIVAYRAQNTVIVRITDLTKVGPVVDASVAAGSNEVQSIDFGLKDDGPARRDALKKAVADARAKAEAMAEALGVKLGELYEASEGGVQVMPMPMMARGAMMEAAGTPVAPGQLDVSASVTLRYRFGR